MTTALAQTPIDEAMRELRRFPRTQWLDLARSDQSHRWRQGAGVSAETYFQHLPEVRDDLEEALVLISGEVVLRRERGESPAVAEYRERFPQFADGIAMQFSIHDVLGKLEHEDDNEEEGEDGGVACELELPGYVFLGEIARGASGVVYKARQESLSRFVAIKVISIATADPRQLARHRQEAGTLAQSQHPNVVHVYEVLEHRGHLHLVMEYVEGRTLAEHCKGRPCTADESARVALTLAQTVHAVHQAGVLHRDLKPSNVLVTKSGELKITDFGLAKLQALDNLLTTDESVLGTPSYMAPEQATGEAHAVGPEADVYSLGAVLYELLTARPPFLGATVLDTLSMIRTSEPVAPRQLQPRTPRDLETICLKCLAKSPRLRYATAAALAEDLRRFREGMPILARRPGGVERLVRLVKRRPAPAALVASIVLLAGVVAVALWSSSRQHRRLSAAALVEAIATADSQALPQLLGKVSSQQAEAVPLIRGGLAGAPTGEPKWVNLSVAELTADPEATGEALMGYLPKARLSEVPGVVEALAARSPAFAAAMWQHLLSQQTGDEARFRLACLAAHVAPADERWNSIAAGVVRTLVQQHPLEIGVLGNTLWPARAALVPSLFAAARDRKLPALARQAAVGIIARYAAEQPQVLTDLILEADPDEFALLLPALTRHAHAVRPSLAAVATESATIEELRARLNLTTKHDIESAYDGMQRRRANALVLAWLLGDEKPALAALRRQADPALRAWLIERLAPLGVGADALWNAANVATDGGVRQALLLAMGETDQLDPPVAAVADLLRTDPDAGVHAACAWLLKTGLKSPAVVDEFGRAPIGPESTRQWYVGPNAHCFTVLPGPVAFEMGSPATEMLREPDEAFRQVRIEDGFAIASEEVTIAQFRRFQKDHYVHERFSPTPDCPMNTVSWFDAAAYCRWLSEQAGVAEDQMCYPPIAEIKPGMRLSTDCLKRTGYRLPTEAEWEYACRGGVPASRPHGEGGQLLVRYARFLSNSDDHAWPVGTLKPNDYGLFDMLGNVMERCHDIRPSLAKPGAGLTVPPDELRELRGGDFGGAPHNLRSARRHANSTSDQWASVGFRVARTLPR